MSKPLVGHHLMRVRIRKNIFEQLKDVAAEEAERTGQHVTVSDLVRNACFTFLLVHDSVQRLENAPPQHIEDAVLIIQAPLLLESAKTNGS